MHSNWLGHLTEWPRCRNGPVYRSDRCADHEVRLDVRCGERLDHPDFSRATQPAAAEHERHLL